MKKTFSHSTIILLAIVGSVFSGDAQTATIDHPRRKTAITENFAMDTVLRLPEVREADTYIRQTTKGKRYLFSMLYGGA